MHSKMSTFNLLTKFTISLFLTYFVAFSGLIGCTTIKPFQDYCSMYNFEKCLAMIEEVSRNEKYAFATTMEQLNETCRCTSKHRFQAFEKIVTGTKKVIERLCEPGPVQEDYLKFSVCYRKVIFKYVKREVECNYWIKLLQDIQSQPANATKSKEEQNNELKTFCCAYNKSLECQLIRLHCDQEALEFFHIHSNSMSQQLIQEHCSSFNDDNEKFCRYPIYQPTHVNEKEPNKKLKFNHSSSLAASLLNSILVLNLVITIFVKQMNLIK